MKTAHRRLLGEVGVPDRSEHFRRMDLRRTAGIVRKLSHPFGEPSRPRGPPYLFPYACVSCRSSFRRAAELEADVLPCVRCRAPSVRLSRKFKPPPRDDEEQWEKVAALIRSGFHFESVPGHYPARLRDVPAFVASMRPYLADKEKRWPALMAATRKAFA